ncbi:hypothetical protein PIB30_062304 [Stylosanthes scabra]|uniref:Uncharacterized protein n=1 Tax=Stylosanthes scabra TaxID=79078 RepID=A0ABU6XJ25_9FABA|nr:hypothetical protein [Stylosanthes scabra]
MEGTITQNTGLQQKLRKSLGGCSSMEEDSQKKGDEKTKNLKPRTSLRIHSRNYDTIIDDPEDPLIPEKILFPFAVEEKLYCFVSPLMSKEEAEKAKSFFPSFDQHELLIKQDMVVAPFEINTRFRNDPKLGSKKANFVQWIERLELSKGSHWKAQELD